MDEVDLSTECVCDLRVGEQGQCDLVRSQRWPRKSSTSKVRKGRVRQTQDMVQSLNGLNVGFHLCMYTVISGL